MLYTLPETKYCPYHLFCTRYTPITMCLKNYDLIVAKAIVTVIDFLVTKPCACACILIKGPES